MPHAVDPRALSLDQLRAFVVVADAGSFTAAGRRLGRVQSAVSHAVATLEELLGVELFDRSGYRPALTAAGATLLPEARRVLAGVDALAGAAGALSAGVEAEVSLVADAFVPLERLVGFATRFEAAWPGVRLRLRTEALSAVAGLVEEGEFALGLAAGAEPLGGLAARPAGRARLVPVASPTHALAGLGRALSAEDVRPWVQVILSGRGREAAAPDRGVLSGNTWRVLDLEAKAALIRAGLGWGRMPEERVVEDLARGTLVRLVLDAREGGVEEVPLAVVWRPATPLGPAARWAIDALVGSPG